MSDPTELIAFQGELGAYSHQACREAFPHMTPMPRPTFESAFAAVRDGAARLAMLPVENSSYGRVPDLHALLPDSGLHIIGEHFVPVRINLLAPAGAKLEGVKTAQSHPVLLGQCRRFLKQHGIAPVVGVDTAGSAEEIKAAGDVTRAALASPLATELTGLETLAEDVQDNAHNTTRFLVMSPQAQAPVGDGPVLTTFVFEVKNIPAALYKAMGGFATNGVNMVKLESYMLNGSFTATRFYSDVEGRPEDANVARAFEELSFFTRPGSFKVLGSYPAHPFRKDIG